MACNCAYAKSSDCIGRGIGYLCRNEKRKKDYGVELCCVTSTYWTGHSKLDIENDFDKMNSCGYRKTELTLAEKTKFDNEDKEEKETLRKLEKDLDKMTPEEWNRLKIQAYADY